MDYQWKTEILWAASELRSRNELSESGERKQCMNAYYRCLFDQACAFALSPTCPLRHLHRVFNTHLHRVFDTMLARFLADLFGFLRNEAGKRSRRSPRLPLLPSFVLRINNFVEGLGFLRSAPAADRQQQTPNLPLGRMMAETINRVRGWCSSSRAPCTDSSASCRRR